MIKINSEKWLFLKIAGEKVYKLFVHNELYYKIVRKEAASSAPQNDDHEIYPQFFIYEIPLSAYISLRNHMERCDYQPFLNRYNKRVLRYLADQFFPFANMGLEGFWINKLIKEARTDGPFLDILRSEDD